MKQDPYASEAETAALLVPDTRTDAQKLLDTMLDERGAWEQGAASYPVLYQIAVELLARPERHELQKDGKHPAPCARFCEATAFRIAERGFHRRIDELTAQRMPPTNEEIKRLIIEGATKFELLGDWCLLIEYDPDVGRIPERWEPRYDVFHAASYVVRTLYGIKEQP